MYLVFLSSHCAPVVTVCVQVIVELDILLGDGVLTDVRQGKDGQEGAENTQRAGDEERILSSTSRVRRIGLDNWKDVAANKGSDLAHCRGNTVILSSNASSTCLGSDEADVVTRAELAECKEYTDTC